MKAADLGDGNDFAIRWRLDIPWGRGVSFQGQVWSYMMVIFKILLHDPAEMLFIENENPVKTFPPYRTD